MISFISSPEIINVVVANIFSWIAASVPVIVAVNPHSIKVLFDNVLSAFFIKGHLCFSFKPSYTQYLLCTQYLSLCTYIIFKKKLPYYCISVLQSMSNFTVFHCNFTVFYNFTNTFKKNESGR